MGHVETNYFFNKSLNKIVIDFWYKKFNTLFTKSSLYKAASIVIAKTIIKRLTVLYDSAFMNALSVFSFFTQTTGCLHSPLLDNYEQSL